jgi:hypothetical protein
MIETKKNHATLPKSRNLTPVKCKPGKIEAISLPKISPKQPKSAQISPNQPKLAKIIKNMLKLAQISQNSPKSAQFGQIRRNQTSFHSSINCSTQPS